MTHELSRVQHCQANWIAPQVRDESSDISPVDLPAIQGTALSQKDLEQGFLGLPLLDALMRFSLCLTDRDADNFPASLSASFTRP